MLRENDTKKEKEGGSPQYLLDLGTAIVARPSRRQEAKTLKLASDHYCSIRLMAKIDHTIISGY